MCCKTGNWITGNGLRTIAGGFVFRSIYLHRSLNSPVRKVTFVNMSSHVTDKVAMTLLYLLTRSNITFSVARADQKIIG